MQKYYPGAVVKGTVVSIKPYGAFISLDDNVNGLLHISEITVPSIVVLELVI